MSDVSLMVYQRAMGLSRDLRLKSQTRKAEQHARYNIWNLLEDGNLFRPFKDGLLDDELHFAQMVSLMGPPPKQFVERSDRCRRYWDSEGNWIAATQIPNQTLETREMRLTGDDRDLLLALVRKILRWLPEERPSAEDLYQDKFVLQFMEEVESSA